MVRVRFAPSPTGYLHIGGARTALFNWLYARHTGGKFLLRIEDTDLERSTDESRASILEALEWMGLDWDEDIVRQSLRRDVHVKAAQRLLAEGRAYKCYCTADDVAAMRERAFAEGRTRIYERTCRDGADGPDAPYTVRIKMPTEGATTLQDMVLGEITVDNDNLDDFIILRSDGTPTYNFVVVCDDAFMEVTHVVRGQDHMSNTFRQYHVYGTLGLQPPTFAHLPLVDGLSKRKGSASVQHYRDQGYLAEAVNNYIARLGWSHGDEEIFSTAELVEKFDVADVNAGSGRYDEEKMSWVNTQWMQRLDAADIATRLVPFLAAIDIDAGVDDRLTLLVSELQPRAKDLVDMADKARFAYQKPSDYDAKAVKKWMKFGARAAYLDLIDALEALDSFTTETIETAMEAVLARHELKMGKLAQPVRVALTGTSVSPGIFQSLAVVGRD